MPIVQWRYDNSPPPAGELENRKRLAMIDRQACLQSGYEPGTVCLYQPVVLRESRLLKDLKDEFRDLFYGYHEGFVGRMCRVVKTCDVFAKWAKEEQGLLSVGSFEPLLTTYEVIFLPRHPFLKESPMLKVKEFQLIPEKEAANMDTLHFEDYVYSFGEGGYILKLKLPQKTIRTVEKVAYYCKRGSICFRDDFDDFRSGAPSGGESSSSGGLI